MKKVISVRFKENGKSYYFDPAGADIKTGEYVIVETARGIECGEVVQGVREIADAAVPKALKPITRMADSVDIRRMRQNREDEKRAYRTCQECIARHGLEMKLVEAEYTLDRSKIMFYFTADGRVDFRELVKDLAGIFHTRIELRQIGVRDESKMIGGLGICGQPFCCSRFLKDFQPVSIKMAKEQGLSLNPTKISGACGRLMCCLAYEESAYEYLNSIMPMVGSTVRTPDGLGTVLEVNPVSGYLRVRCGTESLSPRYYKVGVCEYISGGKRAPRRPDPDDDYSGVRNPAPVVASSDDGEKRCAGGGCARKHAAEKE
jgi:cell fate regulator YaaT (PSP1 superfamily)